MKPVRLFVVCVLVTALHYTSIARASVDRPAVKDWTLLVFINGYNSLDSFGSQNIAQMEQVGSTDHINVVVQWASNNNPKVKRILVQKENDLAGGADSTGVYKVSSPSVQELDKMDMGDYNNLADFLKWGATNYPANHYFVDVWDHGNGWHLKGQMGLHVNDISFDDNTGHFITTAQLGNVLRGFAAQIGHKVELYGSDACMMQMIEVNTELADSVQYVAGSEETEPGAGWPYDTFLAKWAANTAATPVDIGKYLTASYRDAYIAQKMGSTMSLVDLSQNAAVVQAVQNMATAILAMSDADTKTLVTSLGDSTLTYIQQFALSDYSDMTDMANVLASNFPGTKMASAGISSATKGYILDAQNSPNIDPIDQHVTSYTRAQGLSIWLPRTKLDFTSNLDKYKTLKIYQTSWKDALTKLTNAMPDNI